MGYNSTFSGSFTPNKPIPEELVKRINDAELDVQVAGALDDNGEPGDVVPWSSEMKGYNFVEDVVKVQRLLAKHGITLSGEVARTGEGGDDFDKVEVRRGRVYYRSGYLAYRRREEKGVADVTRYAVRVWRALKGRDADGRPRRRFVGWAGPVNRWGHSQVCKPQWRDDKSPVTDRAPNTAHSWSRRAEARELAQKLAARHPAGKTQYDVVSWEDAI